MAFLLGGAGLRYNATPQPDLADTGVRSGVVFVVFAVFLTRLARGVRRLELFSQEWRTTEYSLGRGKQRRLKYGIKVGTKPPISEEYLVGLTRP